ncbi:MAG: alanine racemase [Desulfovibrio sp.]|nr:alanine racemase [Desulfovibrio sp.]
MSECYFSPSCCHIDLGALTRNFFRMGDPSGLLPVIKSDAYGHGLMPVARTLDKAGAQHFAVGCVSEGCALRKAGFHQQIVPLLGAQTQEDWNLSFAYHLTTPILDMESLKLAALACPDHRVFPVAIACNTGMGRLGFSAHEMPDLIEGLRRHPMLKPVLALSHLACADMPEETIYTLAQQERFRSMTNALRAFFPNLARSLNNSAGLQNLPDSRFELCRPGITLYGGNPFAGTAWEAKASDFEWVMSVSAPVLQVRHLKAGQSISYGRIFTAPQDMTIAVIGIGYASGFNRALSNCSDLLINGRRCPQIGRVCMGMIMADVSRLGATEVGDLAWVIGGEPEPGQRVITAQELATELGTISYEVLCLFGMTNRRIYH